jgi:nicotinamide-nucleotide amidase
VSESNAKQADFPQGATVLQNQRGTAPGFSIFLGKSQAFFMPGVPSEMQAMFETQVTRLLPTPEEVVACIRLRTFGLPGSEVNELLRGVEEAHDVIIGYRASNSEIEVKVLATGSLGHEEALQQRARAATSEIKEKLGSAVYTEGTKKMPEVLGELLLENKLTLGLAESCTGGLVSQLITKVPGASRYFFGSICSYDNSVKKSLLHVRQKSLLTHGAVSEQVAREMAEGARIALGVDIALSLSGIAGPGGGTDEKPVGLVHLAVATPWGTVSKQRVFRGTREQIQMRASLYGIWLVRAQLLEHSGFSS